MDTMSFARLLCSLLLDSAAKGTVLLLVAWLAVGFARCSSAALRHSIWCMAMVGLLLSPVAAWLLPTWQIPILPPLAATVAEVRLPGPARSSLETGETALIGANSQLPGKAKQFEASGSMVDASMAEASSLVPLVVESPAAIQSIVESDVRPLSIVEWVLFVVSVVWILGVTVFGGLLVVGLWRTVCMRNRSVVIVDGEWPRMLTELRQRLGLSRSVELREHADSVVPLTWGIWRPVVLVPQIAREWAEPMRRAVLLHELAHVQRGDVACQVLGRLTCVLYWFHPLSWFALRQLRQEREQACDDAVVHSGEKASDYAEQLLAVARLCCAPRGLSLGVAMAEGSSLERRVIALFDSARSHGPVRRIVAIALVAMGVLAVGTISSMEPVASSAVAAAKAEEIATSPSEIALLEKIISSKMGVASPEEIALLNPAFGEAKRGIQLGVAATSRKNIAVGERIPLRLYFRNVGDQEVTFQYHPNFMAYPPSVVNAKGETMGLSRLLTFMEQPTYTVTLKPGENYGLSTYGVGLGKELAAPSFLDPVAGQYKLTFSEGIFWSLNDPTEKWSEGLHSGPLEFEIGPIGRKSVIARVLPNPRTEPHAAPKTVPILGTSGRAAQEQMELLKPVFGKVKLGIQLGLAIGSLERTFPEGGHIPLWLFYRNVGDKELTFQTTQDYMNDPVTVTDGNGNPVQVSFMMHWMDIAPLTITLKPGEVWRIATTGLNLGQPMPSIKPVTGKYKLTCPQGIWDVNTTPQLRTDIPALPSLPSNISPANPDAPPSPDTPVASPATPVGQMVETPNWSEQLDTGTIEFEIPPGKYGQPEARVLAMADEIVARSDTSNETKPVTLIVGRVLNPQKQPMAGATVVLTRLMIEGEDRIVTTLKTMTADESGTFRVEVPDEWIKAQTATEYLSVWSWTEQLSRDGFGTWPLIVDEDHPLKVILFPPQLETIHVVDSQGKALQGTIEQVNCGWGMDGVLPDELVQKVLSSREFDGTFALVGFPLNTDREEDEDDVNNYVSGRRGLWLQLPERGRHFCAWTRVPESKGTITTLTIPDPVRFQGKLTSADGNALPESLKDVQVSLEQNGQIKSLWEGWYFHPAGIVACDAEGRFEIVGVDPHSITGIKFQAELGSIQGWTWRKEQMGEADPAKPGVIPVELPLVRTRTVRGQLTDNGGQPLPGIELGIIHGVNPETVREDGGATTSPEHTEKVRTDAEGRFSVDVIPGIIKVSKAISPGSNLSTALSWPESFSIAREEGRLQIDGDEALLDLPPLQLTVVNGKVVPANKTSTGALLPLMGPLRGMVLAKGEQPTTTLGIAFLEKDGSFRMEVARDPVRYVVHSMADANELPFGEPTIETTIHSREPLVLNVTPKLETRPFRKPGDTPEPGAPVPRPMSRTISGQIINDLKLGIPNAEVLIVAGADLNDPREGKVIAQGKTDVLGNYSIAIPEAELGKRSWGQVWRRAPGFAATRGNTMQSLESLTETPLQHNPLVSTEGLHLVVHDPAGKPLANARVEAISVKVNQGIGYTLPAAWRDDNSGVSDAEGRVHLPYIDPGSLNQLEITPEGSSAATRFSPNYFLNYRPEETVPHFIFPTYKTGTIEGQLVAGPGVTLPKDLKIPLMTLTGKVDVAGVREVTVDEAGRFQIPDMPIGEISILKFLDDAQPLRSWISERAFVKADETTKLEIPIVTGTRVTGRVQKSDTKASVHDYEFEVYYGPAIKFRGSELWLLKHPVKTDAEGKYELLLPPGPINLRLTRYVDGYSDATSWLPRKQQGTWGPLFEIRAQADFELPSIELVKMLPIQGKLIDQNEQPLIAFDWMVYGYPEIPGEDDGFVMNSMAGVQPDKTGHFDGTYPETYPPVRWSVSHRVWKTKYEFDDLKYAAKVVTRDPLVLRVDTTTPLEE